MANGNGNQQWGYPHFQHEQDTAQAGNFIDQPFGHGSGDLNNNTFSVPQQWSGQESQFLHENTYSDFQPHGSDFQIQHFQPGNHHAQGHQHPQSYGAPLPMESASEMAWNYDFDYNSNPLTGIDANGVAFTHNVPQDAPNNIQPSAPAYPQDLASHIPSQQQQFATGPAPSNAFEPGQSVNYGRSIQQSPPQGVSQPIPGHRQAMEYAQAALQPQQQPSQPSAVPHHHPPAIHSQQQQHQHQHHQHQQHQQQQHGNIQQRNHQPGQISTLTHGHQTVRTETPQPNLVGTEQGQPPFNGRNSAPLSMQQHHAHFQPQQQGQENSSHPTVAFSAPQQHNMQSSVFKTSSAVAHNSSTQARFVLQSPGPAQQRMITGPGPATNGSQGSSTMNWTQSTNTEPLIHGQHQQQGAQLSPQPRANSPTAPATASIPPPFVGLTAPRVLGRNDNALPLFKSRYVGFSPAPFLYAGSNSNPQVTLGEIYDPDEISELSYQYGSSLITADGILWKWVKALKEGDVAGQNELEQHLTRFLGGKLPEIYVTRMQEARAAKKKATAQQGPERSKTRPKDEAEAAEWDALGITYLSNPQPTTADIGVAVAAFGKLIRGHVSEFQKLKQKLKSADSAASTTLKDQITRKLGVIDRAVAATNEWGDPQVVANLGGNQKLISDFVTCLIHANNSGDHNGKVPKDVLRLMSAITTIEQDFLMTSLQFAKISKKFESKGDDEVKDYVRRIKENAENRKENLKAAGQGEERTSTPDPTVAIKELSGSGSSDTKPIGGPEAARKKAATTAAAARATAATLSTSTMAKRSREDETDVKPVKRVATESPSSQGTQKALPAKVVVAAPTPTTPAQSKLFGSGMLNTKKTPIKAPVRPLPAKADASKIESKLDPKKEALKRAAEAARAKKMEATKNEASSASKLGGISALLDSISNSKPKQTSRSTPDKDAKSDKEEKPEEKARRLRKEKRRHLRVSWKEGEALTDVRVFQKDANEDEGRASNMIRDAHDDRSEGMMLKQGLMSGSQADEEEEEEEEDELPYRPWFQPSLVDFAALPQEVRVKNFTVRGGLINVDTPQQKFVAERENKELMVVYTDASDIPPTPKSPYLQSQDDEVTMDSQHGTIYDLGQDEPKLAEIHLRWTESSSRGLSWARLNALRRAQKGRAGMPAETPHAHSLASAARSNIVSQPVPRPAAVLAEPKTVEDRVVALLTSDRVKNWVDPSPVDLANPKTNRRHDYDNPDLQRHIDNVENIFEQFKGKPFPATQPPDWMKNDKARIAEWWYGHKRDQQRAAGAGQPHLAAQQTTAVPLHAAPQVATTAADQNAAAWSAYYAQLQQQQLLQQQQGVQAQASAQASQHGTDANTAAWTAYFAQQQQQQQAASQQAASDPNAQVQALLAALGSGPAQAQPQPAAAPAIADSQIQALLATLGAGTTARPSATAYATQEQAQFQQAPDPSDPNYAAYIMSLVTGQTAATDAAQQNYFQASSSNNAHHRDDSRDRSDSDFDDGVHPSRRAHTRGATGTNRNNDAHLRGINREKIGTKACLYWAKGKCQKGDQCTFRHD
ncbi:hypothetical protein BD289DRAFT_124920 [Coniella lustricola]|uniref:C3H1-type domain-containing protein n=1 Tax=Coniella lustricola TaxID=2025994 RepID=A0A2T3AFS5_9PEZI|nr:hypothetical protein BD289DRAFT_124920 [Coniella lustricola]